jgi:hypothetical protein
MQGNWKIALGFLGGVLLVATVLVCYPQGPAQAQPQAGSSKYTVVGTDGTHLVVADNVTNKVYFYAIEKDGKPGDELKFRGTINLNDVGKDTIRVTNAK